MSEPVKVKPKFLGCVTICSAYGFRLIPEYVTLNDHEWAFYVDGFAEACLSSDHLYNVDFGGYLVNLNEDRLINE